MNVKFRGNKFFLLFITDGGDEREEDSEGEEQQPLPQPQPQLQPHPQPQPVVVHLAAEQPRLVLPEIEQLPIPSPVLETPER